MLLFHKINTYKKAIVPALLIMLTLGTTSIALSLVDNDMSPVSAFAQEINSNVSNETLRPKAGDGQLNTEIKIEGNKSSEEAKKFYDVGRSLFNQGNFNGAIGLFDKALAINPNNTGVLNDKGVALSELKNFNGAIALFDKVLAINPNSTKALSEKGNALLNQKNFNEAIALFDKVLAINPNNTGVLNDKEKALDALNREK